MNPSFDLGVEGGTVITPHGRRRAHVYVRNGTIAAMTQCEVVLSRIRMRGCLRIARALASRCFSPAREPIAALACHGLVSVRQRREEYVDARLPKHRHDPWHGDQMLGLNTLLPAAEGASKGGQEEPEEFDHLGRMADRDHPGPSRPLPPTLSGRA
jgi:hypothetical protein